MVQSILYYILSIVIFLFNLLPIEFRIGLIAFLIKLVVAVSPDHKRVAMINLEIVFPDLSDEQRKTILTNSYRSWAVVVVDLFRLDTLDDAWLEENIEFPQLEEYKKIREQYPDRPCLLLTGHLGSFEMLTRYVPYFSKPMAFIARKLEPPALDRWWNERRTKQGNVLIPRRGAIKQVLKHLGEGQDVGILFDQNVVRSQAVFVDWFGRPAATTPAVAMTAIEYQCPIFIFSIQKLPNMKYRMNMIFQNYQDIYQNEELSYENKLLLITERASNEFQKLILLAPEEWFWFHRRWKTSAIPGEGEQLYKSGVGHGV